MPTPEQLARGFRLKQARLKAGFLRGASMSQGDMADLVAKDLNRSLSQAQWSDYERGITDPPYDVTISAGRISETPPEYIAFGVIGGPDPHLDRRLTDDGPDSDRARAERASAAAEKKRGKKRA